MSHFRKRSLILLGFPFLVFLSGCSAKPECDSIETRNAVLQTISDDHDNPLVAYASRNSTANNDHSGNPSSDAAKPANSESAKPLYLLGERMVTTSASDDKRQLQCSGAISVSVGDLKATKEVNFTVQQSSGGKVSVSVAPFKF